MQVTCFKCSQPIALADVVELSEGHLSHVDCVRHSTLTSAERQLIFTYCWEHDVAECPGCGIRFRFWQLGADVIGKRTNMCPRCGRELTDGIRTHLYSCAMTPTEVRRRAQDVRGAAQMLIKESQQLRDTSDVLIRQAEATLFERQQALRVAMTKRMTS